MMLVLGITGIALAQKNENYSNPRTWEQRVEIPFENNGKIIVTSNYAPLNLMADKINLDSLFQIFLSKYEMIDDEGIDAKTYIYSYDKAAKKELITIRKHATNSSSYGILEGTELVKLKTDQDTLMFSLKYDFFPFKDNRLVESKLLKDEKYILNYIFVVNSIEDLKAVKKAQLSEQIREAFKNREENALAFKNPDQRWVILKENTTFKTPFFYNGKNDVVELSSYFGAGWIRNQFVPSIATKLSVRINKLSIGVGTDHFITFRDNLDVKNNVYSSLFLSARIGFWSKQESMYKDARDNYNYRGGFSIGYLKEDKSGYFGNNAYRFEGTIPIAKHLSIATEVYYSTATKQVYPGIRLNIF